MRSFNSLVRLTFCCLVVTSLNAHSAAEGPVAAPVEWQLWKINADGTGLAPLAKIPGYSCGSPKWSPDGRLVAFDTRRVDQQVTDSQIATVRADGTGFRLLGPGGMPTWSPDGKLLVFHTYAASVSGPLTVSQWMAARRQCIVVINADGTGRETIVNHFGSPRWLPRGNEIALIGATGGLGIFDLATGKERSVFSGVMSLYPGFALSHDGRNICFGLKGGGVYLATLDDKAVQPPPRVLAEGGNCYHASWSPDDKRVVFAWKKPATVVYRTTTVVRGIESTTIRIPESQIESLHQLYLLDVDLGASPVLLPGQNNACNNTNPDWSPDGKTIIFASSQAQPVPLGQSQ